MEAATWVTSSKIIEELQLLKRWAQSVRQAVRYLASLTMSAKSVDSGFSLQQLALSTP